MFVCIELLLYKVPYNFGIIPNSVDTTNGIIPHSVDTASGIIPHSVDTTSGIIPHSVDTTSGLTQSDSLATSLFSLTVEKIICNITVYFGGSKFNKSTLYLVYAYYDVTTGKKAQVINEVI